MPFKKLVPLAAAFALLAPAGALAGPGEDLITAALSQKYPDDVKGGTLNISLSGIPGYEPSELKEIEWNPWSGRFTAVLVYNGRPQRVMGSAEAEIHLPVANRRLEPGAQIAASDIGEIVIPAAKFDGHYLREKSDIIGKTVRQSVSSGKAIPPAALE